MLCDKYKRELEQKEKEILEYKAMIEKLLQHCNKSISAQYKLIDALQQKRAKQLENALKRGTISEKGAKKALKRFKKIFKDVLSTTFNESYDIQDIEYQFRLMLNENKDSETNHKM